MKKSKSMNLTISKRKGYFIKKTSVNKEKEIKSIEDLEKKHKNIIKKIPYDEKLETHVKLIEVNKNLTLEEKNRKLLNSLIIKNITQNNQKRLSKMRNKIDNIFHNKLTINDQIKYSTYFRKGLTKIDKEKFLKENSNLNFPCLQKKKNLDNKLTRSSSEFVFKQSFQSVSEFRINILKNNYDLMNRECRLQMGENFKLAKAFKEKNKIKDKFIDIEKDKQIQNIENQISYAKTFKEYKIRENSENFLSSVHQLQLKLGIEYSKNGNMSLSNVIMDLFQFYKRNFISKKPFEYETIKILFRAIKEGRSDIAANMIKNNPFLIQNFDYSKQNPVHYAARFNMRDIIIIGSVNYANFNDRDYFGKTPLHYAASSNNVEILKLLLFEMANPLIRSHEQALPIDLTKNVEVIKILKFAILLYKLHNAYHNTTSYEKIKNGLIFHFKKQ